ncbi:MAG: virulence RhuM family protein [Methanoregulaceae archaeon]|nr:virulence RhuM family protein [Methanoregulaceae archaeon]
MSGKRDQPNKNNNIVRSSAAEYLTFVAATGEQTDAIEVRYQDENVWLTQKMMAALYGVTVPAISQHLKRIFSDGELEEEATVKYYLTVQSEGSRQVERSVAHYNLQIIIAVGFKIENDRAVQFRKWAGQIVKDYTIQGWVMDAERLKKGHMFTDEYFERQLELIREIRLSERKFYQKVTDLYATAFDYDASAPTTKDFFALVQNKMHWAVHRHTAAELIVERADAEKEHMGLTTWESAPHGKIIKSDVSIAKNYLSQPELDHLARIVSMYLDYAELQATRKVPMSMEDWAKRLDGFLEFNEHEILIGPGRITHEQAKLHAESEFEKYRIVQDRLFRSDFDRFLSLENEIEGSDV